LPAFCGAILQTPPAFSAAKVRGRRAYELARRRQDVKLAPRAVRIHEIRLLDYAYPMLDLEVRCGKGTYIRALARDLGERLACGGYITALRRTRIGPFLEDAALPLDADAAAVRRALVDLSAAVAELPRLSLPDDAIGRFRQGQSALGLGQAGSLPEVAVFDESGRFWGVAAISDGRVQPEKVIHRGD
jgi:tRNA pseudouridine55 synthase